jgi:uncharacterized protein YjbI with pentapeptide repeats
MLVESTEDQIDGIRKGRVRIISKLFLDGAHMEDALLAGASISSCTAKHINLHRAVMNHINISDSDISFADMRRSNMQRARVSSTKMQCVAMNYADLQSIRFQHVKMRGVNLHRANLLGGVFLYVDMAGACCRYANMQGVKLQDVDLEGADLTGADLRAAHMNRVNINKAWLSGVIGNGKEIKSIHLGGFPISYTAEILQIDKWRHPITDWWRFDDEQISGFYNEKFTNWWRKWKPLLQQIIETSPATPTGREKS